MTSFAVDLDQLLDVVERLAAFEQALLAKLGELDAAVDDLHLGWTGDAADGHRAAHDLWRTGADEMHQAGVRMREAAERAHANYTRAVAANQQMWAQTR